VDPRLCPPLFRRRQNELNLPNPFPIFSNRFDGREIVAASAPLLILAGNLRFSGRDAAGHGESEVLETKAMPSVLVIQ
jgi:hypothetical protein